MMDLDELPTSSKELDHQEDVNNWICKKCTFTTHFLPSLILHEKSGCCNKVDTCAFSSCQGCAPILTDFLILTQKDEPLFTYLSSHGVLPCHIVCRKCGDTLSRSRRSGSNSYEFRCNHRNPKNKRLCGSTSLYSNTFFANTRLSPAQICRFVAFYLTMPPPRSKFMTDELAFASATYSAWASFVRAVCVDWAKRESSVVGGAGKVVEVDEAKFEGQWVFGGIERGTGRVVLVPVPDRATRTLAAVIRERLLPGTVVATDRCRAYGALRSEGYEHVAVGAHTRNIERWWVVVRRLVPRGGRRGERFGEYLAECMFLWRYHDHGERLHGFWRAVASLYPGNPHP